MKTLKTVPGQNLVLGHRGENLATRIIFSIAPWVETYGPGTAHLLHQRQGDSEPYPVATLQEGTEVSWDVTDGDTALEGYGKYELRYYVAETLVKSSVGETYTMKALQYGAEPPDPIQGWVDHVLEKENEIYEAASETKDYSEAAERAAGDALTFANAADQSAGNARLSAKTAADQAGQAAGSAKEAKEAAEEARKIVDGADVTAKPGQLIRVKSVDENGKPTAWEAVPWGYTEGGMVEILPETDAVEGTDPNYGKCWQINKAPDLTVGETYTVIYNGTPYECVCHSGDDTGLNYGVETFALGNFSVVGGANTGEPFAMLIFPSVPQIMSLDLTGATSVKIGIMGKTEIVHPIPGKFLPEGVPYVEQGEVPFNFTFDGDFTGKEVVDLGGGARFVKVSDAILTMADFIGATATLHGEEAIEVTAEMLTDANSIIGCEVFFSAQYDTTFEGVAVTSGLHFLCMEVDGEKLYIESLVKEGATVETTIAHKIDPRCLPDNQFVVNVDVSAYPNVTADKTSNVIYNAVKNGKNVVAYVGNDISHCIYSLPNAAFFSSVAAQWNGDEIISMTGISVLCVKPDGSVLIS